MKVYCKDCKFVAKKDHDCMKCTNRESVSRMNRLMIIPYCMLTNPNNNCKEYKRKWYKFWVRSRV